MHKVILWIQGVILPALGAPGTMVVAFFDSSFLSIPEINDILVVTSSAATPGRAWLFVLMATLGSVVGCLALREVGRRGGEPLLRRRFGAERLERSRAAFKKWDILALAIPSMLPPPMPFKMFVLSAGVFGLPLPRFVATVCIARAVRYSFWGFMGAAYGDRGLAVLREFDRWFLERGELFVIAAAAALLGLVIWALRRRFAAGVGEAR